jgi:hypothetical protein
MKRHAEYASFDRCIYCLAPRTDVPLSDEHIIPEMIGGRLVIDDASCAECAGQTHAFEGHACDIYRPIRRQLNFPSKLRGRKDRERRKQEKFILLVDDRRVAVPVEEFPALMLSLAFPLPTILTGAPPSDLGLAGGVHNVELMPQFGEKLNEIKRKFRASSVSIVGVDKARRMDEGDLGRMLAKIAHSYTVAEKGLDTFRPFLCDIIRGEKPYYLSHYIGCQLSTVNDASDLHEISFDDTGIDAGRFIVVRIRLFANFKTPAHLVVVGEHQ